MSEFAESSQKHLLIFTFDFGRYLTLGERFETNESRARGRAANMFSSIKSTKIFGPPDWLVAPSEQVQSNTRFVYAI